MRLLLLLPLFLLGVSCIQILDQLSLMPEGDDSGLGGEPANCNFQITNGDVHQYCPACKPSDGNPTYPVYYVSLDDNCASYTEWVACPSSKLCAPDEWPAECQVTWGAWSDCDATCGGGQKWRRRSLPLGCMSCHSCDIEYQSCNTQACGRDCELGDWLPWGICSHSCLPYTPVVATQTRTRFMRQGVRPGRLCDPNEAYDVRTCDPKPPTCAINCNVSTWSDWSQCSATCGCGVQHRLRVVTQQPNDYGAMCPHLFEERSCFCHDCPQKCQMSEWGIGACTGDCYLNYTNANGEQVVEYPQRRKTRYIIQEGKGGEAPCSNPCGLTQTEPCKDVPPCKNACELNDWGNWTGECPTCIPYGQPVPVQSRERSVRVLADGACGCTREERVCDVPWCCDDCVLSEWSEWSPCNPEGACPSTSGHQTRRRGILRPPCPRKSCDVLEDTRTCEVCCPRDCEVSPWVGWLGSGAPNQCAKERPDGTPGAPIPCGPDKGKIKYTRQILVQPNACGVPCPDTARELECYPPKPCCPVNCTLGDYTYSPCFGCGNNARRWRKQIILNRESCGGVPCCPPDGCALFRPDDCENPPPCPQMGCVYSEWGEFGACPRTCRGDEPNYQCAVRYLIHKPDDQGCPGNLTDCRECNSQCCPVDCQVSDWNPWGQYAPSCGDVVSVRVRTITVPQACHGAPCPPTMQHNTSYIPCPQDCVVDEWGSWSLCKTCLKEGEQPGTSIRKRAILIHPAYGGAMCPDLIQTITCPNTTCDVDCAVSEWGPYGTCNVICGDGFQLRSRTITRPPKGAGLACPPLTETKYCFMPCANCILGPLEYGPCGPSCSNAPNATGYRRVSRGVTPLVQILPDGTRITLEMCPFTPYLEPCSIPCCPVDCIMSPWSGWGDCIDGVHNRTRHIATYPSCHGAACPDCRLEKDVCNSPTPDGECEFGEACEEGFAEQIPK